MLNLQSCLVTHPLDRPPKVLYLQQVANQYKSQHFALPHVVLDLPEILENEVHVHRALQFSQLKNIILRKSLNLIGEVPAEFQVMTEPFGPIVLHIKQVGLVHRVNGKRWSHATTLIPTLAMATQICESASTRCAPCLLMKVVASGDLGGVFPIGEARTLQVVNFTVELFLLATLKLL